MRPTDPSAYGEAWAGAYDPRYASRDDPALVGAAIGRHTGGRRVLDFGVGTGRLAIPLQGAGFQVAGIDASPAMVEVLRAKPGGDAVEVHLGDFVTTRLGRRFDAVLIAFSTLFLLPDQETQVACLASAAAHLDTAGVVIVEAFVPDHTRWDHGRRVGLSHWDDDTVELEVARHDRASQRIEVRYLVLSRDGFSQRPLALRYAWPTEIDLMARAAGLTLRERVASWAGDPYVATSEAHVSTYTMADRG